MRRSLVHAVIGLTACASDAPSTPAAPPSPSAPMPVSPAPATGDAGSVSPWVALGSFAFDGGDVVLPWQDQQQGIALEMQTDPFGCFTLTDLADDGGHAYIGGHERGPYCTACEERVSVAAGGALFVLPSGERPFAPAGRVHVRFERRDCRTLARAAADPGARVTVRARALEAAKERGTLAVRLVATGASALRDADLEPLRAALNAELAPAGLDVQWASSITRSGSPSDATFSRLDLGSLSALVPAGAENVAPAITVVLAGCLLLTDPALETKVEPEGYTPHIPGGAGPADAVFIKGSLCGTPSVVPVGWSTATLAHVMAHELGHYLGLYHSVESDGTTDALGDTGATNLMFYKPTLAESRGLTPAQGRVVRRHPFVSLR